MSTPTITIDQSRGDAYVFSFKDGLLSPIAHDLRIKVGRWSFTFDPATKVLEARFDAASLAVDVVMRDGQPAPGVASEGDKQKIGKNIRDEVLMASRHPEIRFRATLGEVPGRVAGELELAGKKRPLAVDVRASGDKYVAEAVVHQPDFGIKPYSAMLGTLKIKPDVRVQVNVPRAAVEETK